MTTLRIEYPITDLVTWQNAFDHGAVMRTKAGVRSERIKQPVDDGHAIVIDLDFDTVEEAKNFLGFLEANIWSSSTPTPGMAGTPRTVILKNITTSV